MKKLWTVTKTDLNDKGHSELAGLGRDRNEAIYSMANNGEQDAEIAFGNDGIYPKPEDLKEAKAAVSAVLEALKTADNHWDPDGYVWSVSWVAAPDFITNWVPHLEDAS